MQYICEVCAASVDELGFKIPAPEISEAVTPKTCVDCRMESMRKRALRSDIGKARKRPSEMFSDDMPDYRKPYAD